MATFKDVLTKIKKATSARYAERLKVKLPSYPNQTASESNASLKVRRESDEIISKRPGLSFKRTFVDELTAVDYVVNLEWAPPGILEQATSSISLQDLVDFEANFFRGYDETVVVTELQSIDVGSQKVESVNSAELFRTYISKQLEDLLYVSDILLHSTGEGFSEASFANVADVFTSQVEAVRSHLDYAGLTDTFEIVLTKTILDSVNTIDFFNVVSGEDFSKEDAVAIVEDVVKSYGKQILDELTAEETVSKLINKAFIDIINADDILMYTGNGSFSESTGLSDAVELQIASHLDETLDSYESISTEFNKVFIDHISTSEATQFNTGGGTVTNFDLFTDINDFITFQSDTFKSYVDTLSLEDLKYFEVSKHFAELINSVDSAIMVYSKSLSDSLALTDFKNIAIEKATFETIALDDSTQLALIKQLLDVIAVSDSVSTLSGEGAQEAFQHLANITDSLTTQVVWYRTYLENAIVTELLAAATDKGLIDQVASSELISFIQDYERLFVDNTISSEVYYFNTNKVFEENTSLSEILTNTLDITKEELVTLAETARSLIELNKTDTTGLSEELSKHFVKSLVSFVATSETFNANLLGAEFYSLDTFTDIVDEISFQKDMERAHLDFATLAEILNLSLSKPFIENNTVTDLISFAQGYGRAIDEIVTINDSLEIVAEKYFEENQTISDLIALQLEMFKTYQDLLATSETPLLSFAKVLSESSSITDTADILFSKNIAELQAIADEIRSFVSKGSIDSLSLQEINSYSVSKSLLDSISNNNPLSLGLGKILSDAVTLSETSSRNIFKNNDELIATSDILSALLSHVEIYLENISTTDNAAKNFSTEFLDTISTSDDFNGNLQEPGTGPSLSITATVSDSGLINVQDYVEAEYFAEDYVGTNYTF